ncbi:MAG: four helix bundle protein [Gemmatimonadota bacterium]
MSSIRVFEDLIAWQKARALTRAVYGISRSGEFRRDFRLSGQIQAAAASTMANVAEGFDRGSRGEFHQFLCIAKGSSAEVRSHLYVALDAGYIEQAEFEALQKQAEEVSRIIGGLRSAVSRQRSRAKERPQSSVLSPSFSPLSPGPSQNQRVSRGAADSTPASIPPGPVRTR